MPQEPPEEPKDEPREPGVESPEEPGVESPEEPGVESPEEPGVKSPEEPGVKSPEGVEPELPPGLDVLWGRRGRGQRGPKPGLTVDAIVDAAIALADTDGLEAVSMANVARRLGFTTMSLYRYVDSKEELLQLMYNGSARGAESLVLGGEGWRDRLREWATIQWDVLERHPWLTHMPMAAPPMAPNSLAFVERALQAMDGTPLTDAEKIRSIGLASSYTMSEARMAYDARLVAAEHPTSPPVSFEAILRLLVDEATYPRLYRLAWSGEADEAADARDEFLAGLDCILDGIQALMDRKPHRP